jgi:hypothetical protein
MTLLEPLIAQNTRSDFRGAQKLHQQRRGTAEENRILLKKPFETP